MKKLLVTLLALLMAFTLVGCSNKTDDAPKDDAGTATEAKDEVNLCITMALSTTDPWANRAVQDLCVLNQVYEGLLFYNDLTQEFEYRVAEDYELSEDGKTYTFKINPNAKFHNGDPVKASDVVFSFDRTNANASTSNFMAGVNEYKAIDDLKVEITLDSPSVPFMSSLVQIPIASEKVVTEQGDEFGSKIALAGTGPYYFTSLDQDVAWTLEAFPDYYRGEATIKKINYRPITDSSAALLAMQSGELDYLQLTSTTGFDTLQANSNFNTECIAANHITFLCIDANVQGPMADKRVRQAIAWCLDKDAMNQAAFGNLGTVATHMENPVYNAGAPEGGIVYSYNPDKAKELLAEAGYADGVNIGKLLSFTGSQFEKCAQISQANMAAVGIECEIEWNEQATCIARWNSADFQITTSGWPSTYDYDSFRNRWDSRTNTGFSDFGASPIDTSEWERLIDESAKEQDPIKRKEINQQVNDMIMEEAVFIPLLHKAIPCVWVKNLNVVNRPGYYYVYEWSYNN